MPNLKKVVDISTWQGDMNWDVTRSKVDEVYIRAGSINSSTGICYTDFRWDTNIEEAKLREFKRLGAYFYFRPNFSPYTQADFFSNEVLSHVQDLSDFELTIDVETTGGRTPAYVADQIEAFIDRVHENSGVWCSIYTRALFWNPYVESRNSFGERKLWVARYSDYLEHPWSDNPTRYRVKDWNDFWLWQYSADGNFLGSTYGASSYHIDVDYVNEEPVVVPPPTGIIQYEVLTDTLNVRTGPGIYFPKVTSLRKGEKIFLEDVDGSDSWIKHEFGWSAKRYSGTTYLKKV